VYATAGSPAKLDACRGLGADLAINYREADFAAVIEEETDGAGVNVILDTIGAKYLARNVDSLATSGRLAVIGLMGGRVAELDLAKLMTKRASIYAATLRTRPAAEKAEIVAGTQAHVWPLVADGSVRPIVHEVLDLQEASRAHEIVGQSSHVGKIILRVGG
jgi:NADPH:quinone reductase-like Zn-dependent oxidoreductase